MKNLEPIVDTKKAKLTIAKGRRARWWRRMGSMSKGFHYVDADGKKIRKAKYLERIKQLVIPPAWAYVRISPSAHGRVQAVGMDTTGRIQYIYEPKFAERQQRLKFAKIEEFGKYLPKLRKTTNRDIARKGFPREKVLAVMTRLIASLYFRVGAEGSAKNFKTFGITTLQNKHLEVGQKGKLVFDFVGKSHVKHRSVIVDSELSEVMKRLKELGPKRKLFNYIDADGRARSIKPSDVNKYIKAATSDEFTSKDIRTWSASLLAAMELAEIGAGADERETKKNIVKAVKAVAEKLGNTPSVCRGSYIHPQIIRSYENGITLDEFTPKHVRHIKRLEKRYEPEEKALLKFFKKVKKKGK